MCAPVANMDRRDFGQPDIAINPGARIPADAGAWQSAHAAAACASEGAFDGPIVRQIDLLPRAVVEVRLHVRNVVSRISEWFDKSPGLVLYEGIAGWEDPLLDYCQRNV